LLGALQQKPATVTVSKTCCEADTATRLPRKLARS